MGQSDPQVEMSIKLPSNLLERALSSPYQPLHQRSKVQSPLFLNYWYYIIWGEQANFMDVDELFPSTFITVFDYFAAFKSQDSRMLNKKLISRETTKGKGKKMGLKG